MTFKISEAKALAKKHGVTQTIIFYMNTKSADVGYVSYGINKEQCQDARKKGDKALDEALTKIGIMIADGFHDAGKLEERKAVLTEVRDKLDSEKDGRSMAFSVFLVMNRWLDTQLKELEG